MEVGEKQRDYRHDQARQQAPAHAPGQVSEEDDDVWRGGDQDLLDVVLEFGSEKRRDDVRIGVGDHRHHDDAGGDELHVAVAVHGSDSGTDEIAENHEIQRHRDGRRQQGLDPDPHVAMGLLDDDGLQSDQCSL